MLARSVRSARLKKKLYSLWLVEIASDIVMDRDVEVSLWGMKQNDQIDFCPETYRKSEALTRYKLRVSVKRGPIEDHWLTQEFNPGELNLYFFTDEFPSISHGWTLYEDDRNI